MILFLPERKSHRNEKKLEDKNYFVCFCVLTFPKDLFKIKVKRRLPEYAESF